MRSHVSLRQLSGRALLMVLCAQAAAPALAADAAANRPATAKPAVQPAAKPAAAQREQFVDGIAAIVDKDVITLRELDVAMRNATQDLQAQKIQVPPQDVLQRQVLEQLIMQRVQRHEAERMNVRVEDAQIDQAIQTISQRNRITPAQMQAEVQKSGIAWADYRRQLGDEIRLDRMRQRAVDSNIIISDAEVDAYLKEQGRRGGAPSGFGQGGSPQPAPAPAQQAQPTALALGQILVRVPESADSQTVAGLRKKAEDVLRQLRGGADFASVAAASSDGPEALQGGNMGSRPVEGWPDLFLKAVANLAPGQPSDIVQSGNGFHILTVLGRQGGEAPAPAPPQQQQRAPAQAAAPQGPMHVTQTRARHILIKTSTVMSDEQARQRLDQLRLRIVQGNEPFADLARQNSQDATAPQGGDLGWLNPGETVPPFEQAMNALQPNEISQPIQSPFGWHLIQVQERREQDVADEYQRMQARQALFERRAQPAMEDWLQQLRDRAYVDNRLEKLERLQSTNQ